MNALPSGGYGISAWPDTDDIYARLKTLLSLPVRAIRRERMAEVLEYFEQRCPRSKQLAQRAAGVIPGGVQHNLAFNYPFALAVERCEGAHMWDVDGNRYIDFRDQELVSLRVECSQFHRQLCTHNSRAPAQRPQAWPTQRAWRNVFPLLSATAYAEYETTIRSTVFSLYCIHVTCATPLFT
jgi:hypothetical protein